MINKIQCSYNIGMWRLLVKQNKQFSLLWFCIQSVINSVLSNSDSEFSASNIIDILIICNTKRRENITHVDLCPFLSVKRAYKCKWFHASGCTEGSLCPCCCCTEGLLIMYGGVLLSSIQCMLMILTLHACRFVSRYLRMQYKFGITFLKNMLFATEKNFHTLKKLQNMRGIKDIIHGWQIPMGQLNYCYHYSHILSILIHS